MSTSSPQKDQNNNSYFLDAESPAEMARLMNQNRLFTKAVGLLPAGLDLSRVQAVLDIGCGPGGWVLQLARAFPALSVTGIDISNAMIEYARDQAEAQAAQNVTFVVMDALKPLDFRDSSFGLVNACNIGFLPKTGWPTLLQECRRILQPGGIICLTELEMGGTNSPAIERMYHLVAQALHLAGRGFSPDGQLLGIAFMLRRLLRDAGFQNIQSEARFLDYSAGTEAHGPLYQDDLIGFKLVQPFLLKMEVATLEELEYLYQQFPAEMLADSFCGLSFFLKAWGEKPKQF